MSRGRTLFGGCVTAQEANEAAVNLSASSYDPGFGAGPGGDASVKARIMNLIASVRTVMRGAYPPVPPRLFYPSPPPQQRLVMGKRLTTTKYR